MTHRFPDALPSDAVLSDAVLSDAVLSDALLSDALRPRVPAVVRFSSHALLAAVLVLGAAPSMAQDEAAQAAAQREREDDDADDAAKEESWDVAVTPGETTEVTVDVMEGTWMGVDVSPDGREIVFDLLGDLYLLPIEGGEAKALTSGPVWDMQPRFSPDGDEIAFTSDRAGGDNVWVIRRDGTAPRQISDESFRLPNSPAWSPDGEWIAARKHFSSRRSLGSGEIWLWHSSGTGSGLRLNEKPNEQKDLGEPAFSPDGRYVYFSQDTTPGDVFEYSKDANTGIYSIQRIDRETGEIERVISGPGGAVRPTPSPDGSRLAFVRRVRFVSTLFVHDLRSGENTPVYAPLERDQQEIWAIHGVYPQISWTPDSKEIVFWAGGKIRRVDIDTRVHHEIPFRVRQTHALKKALRFPQEVAPDTFHTKMLRWVEPSPAGDRVVFQSLGRLWLRDLDAGGEPGEPHLVSEQEEHWELYPSFSRDGRSLVYVTWDDDLLGSVRLRDLQSGAERTLTREPGHYVEPVISSDGSTVIFRKIGGGYLTSPLWSKEPGLYRVPADASAEPLRLRQAGVAPHFGAASDRVYFTDFEGDQRVLRSVRIAGDAYGDPEERTHLTSENATEWRVAPSGDWVAFVERFNAYVIPLVAASEPIAVSPGVSALPVRRLSRDSGEFLRWSGNSSTVYWTLGPELFSRDLADAFAFLEGSPDELPEPPAEGIDLGMDVARDVPSGTIALVGGTVITMAGEDGGIVQNGTVVVEGDRIRAVGPAAEVSVPAGAHRVDVSGKVVMPGLIDVHYHGGQGSAEIVPERSWEAHAALAFGVTSIHDPSNDTSTFFAASEMRRAGLITAPRLFSTGTILYGAAGDFKAEVDSLEDARAHLRRLKAAGAFSAKSYNQPRRDQRQMIVAAARELEMMVVNEGGALFQHNMTMVLDGHTGIEHSLAIPAVYDDVLQLWGASEVGNTPTLGVAFGGIEGERYWYHHTEVYEHPRLTRFVPNDQLDARARRRVMAPEEEYNHLLVARLVADLHDAGVSIQLGAHGQREGLAAHWELWMLEQGGMTPLEALRAGTLAGARYLGLDGDLGSLEAGKLADLIVLDENPLEDLRSSESVRYTMVGGRLYDAWTMDEIGNHPRERGGFWFEELLRVPAPPATGGR
ncbi:MAG TPA: amidohydrolase family protein [Thermoanaerobaculia bacterium]|nr:amidohydrolase family protein [Thermoanaerobaculia bacterium]